MNRTRRYSHRGLATLALLFFGLGCLQASNWFGSTVHAGAAVRMARAALDEAAERYMADPTDGNARLLNKAREVFAKEAAGDPTSSAARTLAPSALVQIQALNSVKSALTRTEQKIGSRLMLVAMKRQAKLPVVLTSMRTSVETTSTGDAVVDITTTSRIAGLKALDPFNLKITSSAGNIVRAEVPFDKLEQIAALPQIIAIREPDRGFTSRANAPSGLPIHSTGAAAQKAGLIRNKLRSTLAGMSTAGSPRAPFALNVSEGDKTHRAFDARNFFGVNGTGIKVGVLSDGVDSLAAVQGTGDLGPVTVLAGQAGAGDEGTAMLEIVHDLAPGAQLFFAQAGPTITQFAQNIRDLRTAGCDIIVDDVIFLAESPFQDGQTPSVVSPNNCGVVIQAVNDVTASGALYFSSAGNEGNKDDGTAGTWEGNFNPNGTPPVLAGAGPAHNFGDGGQSVLVTASSALVLLEWSDPLGASGNDYDIYDLDGGLTTIFDASTNTQDGNDDPVEISGPAFSGERLVVAQFSGVNRYIRVENFRGELGISTPGATFGHSCASAAFGVAATPAVGPFPNPFTAADVSETFTADGPRQLFYNADGSAITPGNVLAGGGLVRAKPDITAADGVMTAAPGFNPFFGTSAAAPHAAAIAALIKSANGALTPAQIRTALVSSAIDIEAAGADRDTGAGIVMAFQALQFIGAAPAANLNLGTVTFAETGGDGDGFPEPCERLSFTIPLNNVGGAGATAISATLSSSTAGVVINPNTSAYPNIASLGSANNITPFTVVLPCTLTCASTVNFTLTVTFTGGPSPQVLNFSYILGGPGTPVTFSYTGPAVPIPDAADLTGTAPGAPALAPLVVSGVAAPIFDINFRFDGTSCSNAIGSTTVGLDHTFVNDLQIKLISPASTNVLMINNTDGSGNNFCQTVLDDDTPNPSIQTVVSGNAPFTGTFKPNSPLSAFRGENANGTWNLSAQDFFSGDTGNIRAFSLIITPAVCQTAPCVLTCPSNVTGAAIMSSTAVINYPQPTLTGGCGIVACSPASGSMFPVGTTTVTCTPQSGSPCSFTVNVVSFNVCLQDDANPGTVFLGSTTTGNYRFCCGGTTYSGVAQVTTRGNVTTFQHNPADRRVLATYDGGAFKGTATLQSPPGTTRCTISDKDTRNNSCACQ